jgi:FkbM family methyltransferase
MTSVKRPKNANPIYKMFDAFLRRLLRVLPPSESMERLALWWGYRFQPAPRLSRLRSGPLIQTTHTDHLQLLIYYLGTFEPYCLPYLRNCISEGGTVVDVGANIGVYTLESAVSVGRSGRVIAIEAAPSHAKSLRENIQLNALQNIHVAETAVGAFPGRATLTRSNKDNLGMFSLGEIDGDETHTVSLTTIDDLLDGYNISALDLMKMDIEGSEYNALRGAERTIKKYHPAILIELNDVALKACGSSTGEVIRLLYELNYRGWEIRRGSVRGILDDTVLTGACCECVFICRNSQSLMQKLGLPF